MLLKHVFILIVTATAAFSSPKDLRLLFPQDKQYVYEVTASMTSGTTTPKDASTSWALEGRLLVQVLGNDSQARFQLDDLKTSVNSNTDGYISYQFEEAATHLKLPWIVHYYEDYCLVDAIYLPEEPAWVSNVKRALSLNFQLKKGDGFYTNYETCVHDYRCFTTYMASGNIIKKYISLPSSAKYGSSWRSVPWTDTYDQYLWNSIPDTTTMTTERVYKLDDRTGLVSMAMKGRMQYKTEDRQLFVNTELQINYETELHPSRMEWPKLTRTEVKHSRDDCFDPSCGIRALSQSLLKNRTYEILLNISKKGIEAYDIISNPTMIHSLEFVNLLDSMSQLNYTNLRRLFDDLVLGTSYELETSRNIFLEVLPYSGSTAAVKFVKYLVLEEKDKIEDSALLSLIRKLPFSTANFSQELLQELESFTKLGLDFPQEIRHAAILSFGTLLYQTKRGGRVSTDYFDNMVVKYLRMYVDCPHYMDRLIWLQGLCNIGYSAQKYAIEIFTDPTKKRNERLWAAFASNYIDNQYYMNEPLRAVELLVPVLTNEKEDNQIRMAAIHAFLTATTITLNDFLFVHNYIKNSGNGQLKRFWCTAMKSLERNRNFDGYKLASIFIPYVSNMPFELDPEDWATNNVVIGSDDDPNTSLHLLSMGDDTGLPSFAGAKISTNGKKASIYIVAEGISSNVFNKIHNFNDTEMKAETLIKILENLKVYATKAKEEFHVDFVLKIQEKAVIVAHMNQTRFDSLTVWEIVASVNEFLHLGSHINQQTVYFPSHTELTFPNELGIPVRLRSTTVSFMSVRGNLTAPLVDLHIRYQGTSVTSMSTFGLLVQSEHSARVQKTLVAHLPVAFNISDTHPITFMWPNLQIGGIVTHTHTQVEKNVNGSGDVFTVRSRPLQKNGLSYFFDCDNSTYKSDLMPLLGANLYTILTFVSPTQVFLKTLTLVASPPTTSCGIRLPVSVHEQGILLKLKPEKPSTLGELFCKEFDVIKIAAAVETYDRKTCSSTGEIFNVGFEIDNRNQMIKTLSINNHKEDTTVDITSGDLIYDSNLRPLRSKFQGKLRVTRSDTQTDLLKLVYDVTLNGGEKTVHIGVSDSLLPFEKKFALYAFFCFLNNKERQLPQLISVPLYFDCTNHGVDISKAQAVTQTYEVTATLKNGVTSLTINDSPTMLFSSPDIAWLLDAWISMKRVTSYGFYKECRVYKSSILNLHNSIQSVATSNSEERVLLADCTDKPRFAVLRQKDGGVKVYVGGFDVTATFQNGHTIVNGTESKMISIQNLTHGVKISSKTGVQVFFMANETAIYIPTAQLHSVCGECTGEL